MKQVLLFFIVNILFVYNYRILGQVHIGPNEKYKNIESVFKDQLIVPGTIVYLHQGNYFGYQWIENLSGQAQAWITFQAYENDNIEIAGSWQFSKCAYIKFINLKFKANPQFPGRLLHVENGGSCLSQSHHIIVENCQFLNSSDPNSISAFKFGGVDYFVVRHCLFKNINISAMDFNVCHHGLITDNLLMNCLTGGHIKGGASDISLERNFFMNASANPFVAFELGGDTGPSFYCKEDSFEVKNLYFFSNIIYGGFRGLAISSARNCEVINNTFYNCAQATIRLLTTSQLFPELSNNLVANNLFCFGSTAYMNGSNQNKDAARFQQNIYASIIDKNFSGPYWDSPALDLIKENTSFVFGNNTVFFQSPDSLNFHLVKACPAVSNAMNRTNPIFDFDSLAFSKLNRSVGAFQYFEPLKNLNIPNQKWESPSLITDHIWVDMPEKDIVLRIFNSMGCLVKTIVSNQSTYLNELTPGIYFLCDNHHCKKFMKVN